MDLLGRLGDNLAGSTDEGSAFNTHDSSDMKGEANHVCLCFTHLQPHSKYQSSGTTCHHNTQWASRCACPNPPMSACLRPHSDQYVCVLPGMLARSSRCGTEPLPVGECLSSAHSLYIDHVNQSKTHYQHPHSVSI